MDFVNDLGARAKEQLRQIMEARRGQREKIPPQVSANLATSNPPASLSQSIPSKGQDYSSKQTPHPLASEVDVALGIDLLTSSTYSTEESPLLDTPPDFRVNMDVVSIEPSPLREEDFPSLSRKRERSASSQTYKRSKSHPSASVDKRIGNKVSNASTIVFASPKLSSDKSLSANSCLPSPLSKQRDAHLPTLINPFQPISVPSPPKDSMKTPVVIPPLIKTLRDKGLACPYASYSSSSININFPGKLIEADGPTSSSLIASLFRAEDWLELDRYSSADLENKAAICELKAMGYRAMQSHRAQSYEFMRSHIEELSTSVKRLQEENFHLQRVVDENSSLDAETMRKKLSDLETEVQCLKKRDVEREELVRSNLSLLEKA